MEIIQETEVLVVEQDPETIVQESSTVETVVSEDSKTAVVTSPNTDTVYIGAVGPQGPGGVIGELQFNTLVAPTESRTIDSINISLVDSVIWEVTATDRISGKLRVTVVRGLVSEGVANFIVGPYFGATKTDYPHEYDVQLVAGELILLLQNNHTNNILAEVLRIKTNRVEL